MINKDRLLAITDGVVAIAATIMVLQLVIPEEVSMAALLSQWPTLLAYIISFVQVFLAWHEHHDSVQNAKHINHRVFMINCLWLFFITLLPFATGVVGHSPDHQASMLIYILILFLIQLTITVESRSICRLNNTQVLDYEVIRVIRIISFIGYGLAAASTFITPYFGYAIILILSIVEIVLMCLYDRKISRIYQKGCAEQDKAEREIEEPEEGIVSETILLRCVNCGQEFEHEVRSPSEEELSKHIEWCRKRINHCPKCRMSRMGHGYGR